MPTTQQDSTTKAIISRGAATAYARLGMPHINCNANLRTAIPSDDAYYRKILGTSSHLDTVAAC